ncbi:hypothetical protein BASA81_010827 [Batrachochytrium salamandrivorans]|nr:hypothetical protein BASA81_010827 [Batrachochytrium salamandrivorans]
MWVWAVLVGVLMGNAVLLRHLIKELSDLSLAYGSNLKLQRHLTASSLPFSLVAVRVDPIIHHVMFSTKRRLRLNATSKFQQLVHFNAQNSIRKMVGHVTLLSFRDDNWRVRTNKYGFPFLKDMFIQAQSLVPDAHTFTYFNGDLVFNQSFVGTMDAIVASSRQQSHLPFSLRPVKPRFLAVGLRTNVQWNESVVFTAQRGQFDALHAKGEVFHPSAIDYFTFSNGIWDWNLIPDFVVGRVAYDNWLLNHAHTSFPAVSIVDVSKTNRVLHQTGKTGNMEGHARLSKDPSYNIKVAGQSGQGLKYGWITSCPMVSWWKRDGTIRVFRKPKFIPLKTY